MVDDCQLIERLRNRDRDALRLIYEKYKPDLLRIGACITANRMDTEECLHDVFVSLALDRANIRPGGNLKGYLVTSMANRARDRLRMRRRRHDAGNVADIWDQRSRETEPAAAVIATESEEQLYRAIAELPAEQRSVITLRLHGDLTFEEIAQMENVSINTVCSRYRYALDKLRASLGAGVER